MRLILAGIALLLSACAPAAQSIAPLPATPSYGLAGQSVFVQATSNALEQTRTALEAQIVAATESAHQTQAVGELRATEFHFQETVSAATQTGRETALAYSVTESAATASPRLTQSAALIIATAQAREAASSEQSAAAWWWLRVIAFIALVGIILWYVAQVGSALARRADRYSDPVNAVRVVRVLQGVLIITRLPSGTFQRELLPALPAPGGAIDDEFDTDEEAAEESESAGAPMYERGQRIGAYRREEQARIYKQDEGAREFLLRFLRIAIAINGRDSNRIPGCRVFNEAGYTYGADTHSRALRLFGAQIKTKRGPGGGIWLVGRYGTLGELYTGVGERRFIPAVVIDGGQRSPAPQPEMAAVLH